MVTAQIERQIYSGESEESSKIYVVMSRNVELPPAPYVGMTVCTEDEVFDLEQIRWDEGEQQFFCVASPIFSPSLDLEESDFARFDKKIAYLKEVGWVQRGREENYAFVEKVDSSTVDEDEKFREELLKLSEPTRLEIQRRLDEATYLGRLIVQEKKGLEITRERWKTKVGEAKNLTKWGVILCVGFALIDWIFPEIVKSKNSYLFFFLGWAIFNLVYNEIICPPISLEVDKRREAYEGACYRWSLVTGKQWGKNELAAESTSYNYSEEATQEEIEKHFASVQRNILRIVKNQGVL